MDSSQTLCRFEFSEGNSNKFWEIDVVHDETGEASEAYVIVRYGRIRRDGQENVKEFPSYNDALAYYERKIKEKLRKGYKPVMVIE